MAQSGASVDGPDELWSYDPSGDASTNDVAMDAAGKVLTAVQGDANVADAGDDEVFAWDLARSKTSSSPVMRADPSSGPLAPEGLSVVAIEENPDGKGDFIAVANEGSGDASANNIYVYRRTSGGASESQVAYPGDDSSAPGGEVLDMWFLSRNAILAYHENSLSLLVKDTGTQYEEADRWAPGNGNIQDVDVSGNGSRIAVATGVSSNTGDDTIKLRLLRNNLAIGGGESLETITVPWTKQRANTDAEVSISDNGKWVLLGAAGKTLFYFGLEDAPDEDKPFRFSEFPWTRVGPASVSEVTLAPTGKSLAAGFANGALVVYERFDANVSRPQAERAVGGPIDVGSAPSEATFADGNRSLYVLASGLMAFHQRQFDGSQGVSPLWSLPGVRGFDVSQDGQRIGTIGPGDSGGIVSAYEQTHGAKLTVDAPNSIRPGREANISVTVANNGSTFDAYRFNVQDLPSSWSVSTPEEPLELLPSQVGNATIQLTPSSTQEPGEVTFTVKAISQLAPDKPSVGKADASTTVKEVQAASLDVDTSERSVSQGGNVDLDVDLSNSGNTKGSIELQVRQEESWGISIDDRSTDERAFDLGAGENRSVTVTVSAPGSVDKGTRNAVELVARPASGGSEATATVSVVVDPSYDASFQVPSEAVETEPGQTARTEVVLENAGNTRDTFTLDVTSNASNPEHLWDASLSTQKVTLGDGETKTLTVSVTVPRGAVKGDSATVSLSATSSATGETVGGSSYELVIPEETDDSPLGPVAAVLAFAAAALAVGRRTR